MNAQEKFAALDYKMTADNEYHRIYSCNKTQIIFSIMPNMIKKVENGCDVIGIAMEEFDAIQEQLKELGWIK